MAADDPTKERFEILRRRAKQAARSASQQEQEGLQRRFASIGQIGSGAQIRAEAQAAERGAKRLQQAEETVGLAELAERQRQKELGEQRAFISGEREAGQLFSAEQAGLGRGFASAEALKGRQFSAEQAGLQRQFQKQLQTAQQKFARGERLSAQDFATLEAARGRTFATGEREAAQKFAATQAELGRTFTAEQQELARQMQQQALNFQKEAFDENIRQWELEFDRDSGTIEFNKQMAMDNDSKTLLDDLGLGGIPGIGDIFGGGGAFGEIFGKPFEDPRSIASPMFGPTSKAVNFVSKSLGGGSIF